jgi:hypothetical protein
MKGKAILERLDGIQSALISAHKQGVPLSAASKGTEREAFVRKFLADVFPPIYRFGSGDIVDELGNQTGQIDVVAEYPFAPTLPTVGGVSETRLYLANGVAAVIEVKSDLSAQWGEVERTAEKLAALKRDTGGGMWMGPIEPQAIIPLFAVGFTGWKTPEPMLRKLAVTPSVSGILNIDPAIYVDSRGSRWTGAIALWGLITMLHRHIASVQANYHDPMEYLL